MKKVTVFLLIMVILLTGCNKSEGTLPSDTGGHTDRGITLSMRTPDTLNPIKTTLYSDMLVLDLIYDSLVYVDREMRPVPYLAEKCTLSADGKTIHFTLKSGIQWHDGAAFTSSDVSYTFKAIREAGEDSTYYSRLENIESINIIDIMHFDLVLYEPDVMTLNLLDFPIIPCHRSDIDINPVGTGQYKVSDYKQNQSLSLVRNENWSLSEVPRTEKIEVVLVNSQRDVVGLVKMGEVTAVTTDVYNVGGLGMGNNISITKYPSLQFEYIGFNFNNSRLSSAKVRKAILGGINHSEVIDDVYFGYGEKAISPIPPNAYMYKNLENNEDVMSLLYADGYNESNGVMAKETEDGEIQELRFSLLVNEDNGFRVKYCEAIAKALSDYKILVTVDRVPWDEYISRIVSGDYQMFAGAYEFSANLDFSFMLGTTGIEEGTNYMGYSSEAMDNALLKIQKAKSSDEIVEAYGRFQDVFYEEMPVAGICFLDRALVHSSKLTGIENLATTKIYRNINMWKITEQKG